MGDVGGEGEDDIWAYETGHGSDATHLDTVAVRERVGGVEGWRINVVDGAACCNALYRVCEDE